MPIEYLNNTEVAALIANGDEFQKSAKTGLRKIRDDEVGTSFITYVKHDDTVRQESSTVLTQESVLARNPEELGKNVKGEPIYNEWPIPMATAIKNYGQDVISSLTQGSDFTYHKKQATLKAIELTPAIMKKLGIAGEVLEIKVSWSEEPMLAHVGDYISSGGYSVSKHDMKSYDNLTRQAVNESIDQEVTAKINERFKNTEAFTDLNNGFFINTAALGVGSKDKSAVASNISNMRAEQSSDNKNKPK